MDKAIIEVQNLSKVYRLGTITADTMRESLAQWWQRKRGNSAAAETKQFWALRDVSFQIAPGEVAGIIGRNGAGKSTLLKVLSRITEPTRGRAILRGRTASLLEVGTGFHPDLTGRDNIFLNGAILGMRVSEIRRKFDEIVDFSGVENFIDTPVKRYSSGMYVRLAFAVAAHLEPEILFVDEVLAVGDAAFQKKCLGKMGQVASAGRTVIFVSHNMGAVGNLCREVFWLKSGRLHKQGAAKPLVQEYLAENSETAGALCDLSGAQREGRWGEALRITTLEWLDGLPLRNSDPVRLRISGETHEPVEDVSIGFGFSSLEGSRLLSYDTDFQSPVRPSFRPPQSFAVTFEISELPMAPGMYLLDVGARSGDFHGLDYLSGALQVEVAAGDRTPGTIIRQGAGVRLSCRTLWDEPER